jgi:hypothetical protein
MNETQSQQGKTMIHPTLPALGPITTVVAILPTIAENESEHVTVEDIP